MHRPLSRGSVRGHHGSHVICLLRAMQPRVRVSCGKHKLNAVRVSRWYLQHRQRQCLHSLPCRYLWKHHCTDQCSVHGSVSRRHLRQRKRFDYSSVLWKLHCRLLLPRGLHFFHGVIVWHGQL